MQDSFKRKINYLRISVTDLCNLRCVYCMPEEGIPKVSHEKVLTFEEIYAFTKIAVELGIEKVRLTGGEPLVRKGIVDLVRMLKTIPHLKELTLTTNGILLPQYAKDLKKAGIERLNISLDTLDALRFKKLTRIGNLEDVLKGINIAIECGFSPLKLNCVIQQSPQEKDAQMVSKFAQEKGLQVRFIRQMDTQKGEFWPVMGGEGGKCESCNRIRINSLGHVYPCLFSDHFFDLKKYGMKEALLLAVQYKPEKGTHSEHLFHQIGG